MRPSATTTTHALDIPTLAINHSTRTLNFPTLALDHDTHALDIPTLAINHSTRTLNFPTLTHDLGAPTPNHARTTTTRSRYSCDSVTRAAQCQRRGVRRPRS